MPLYFSAISKSRENWHKFIRFAANHIYPDTHDNAEYNQICSQQIEKTIKNFCLKIGIMVVAFFAAVSGSAYVFITQGVKSTIFDLRIPFTDENSNAEFLLNMALEFLVGTHGFLSFVGLEVTVVLLTDATSILPKVIEYELKQMHFTYQKNNITDTSKYMTFKNILKQTMDFKKYVMQRVNYFDRSILFNHSFLRLVISIDCHELLSYAKSLYRRSYDTIQIFKTRWSQSF